MNEDESGFTKTIEKLNAEGGVDQPIFSNPEARAELKKASHEIQAEVNFWAERIQSESQKIVAGLKPFQDQIRAISRAFGDVILEHKALFDDFSANMVRIANFPWKEILQTQSEAILFAAEHGWFVQGSFGLKIFGELATIARNKDVEGLDDIMQQLIRHYIPNIKKDLLQRYPERKIIIEEAFALHEEGRYLAAIPLFISQADGIGLVNTDRYSLFNLKGGRPEAAKFIEQNNGQQGYVGDFMARPLSIAHPLSKSKPGRMCRHHVLHGIDFDYGTELNSLQAMSFLGFSGWILAKDEVGTEKTE